MNLPANLVLLCGHATEPGGCHNWVESHRADAIDLGWLVSRIGVQIPAEVPVQYSDGVMYLLCDVGHKHPQLADGTYEECPDWEEAA